MTYEHLLRSVTISGFLDRIVLSKKRKKKYYTKGLTIPKKYQTNKYEFKNDILIDKETNEPVIKNIRSYGTERTMKISGQDIWSGMNHNIRAKLSKELKKFFYQHIKNFEKLNAEDYPIGISIDIYDVIENQDLDNLEHIYRKTLSDALAGNIEFAKDINGKYKADKVKYPAIIEDDSLNFVRQMITTFYPIDNHEDREMTITIYKLNND